MLVSTTWNHLTVGRQMSSGLFKILPTNYLFRSCISNVYVFKWDFALNNREVDMP